MNDQSSDSLEYSFNYKTANDRFQRKLLEAHTNATETQLNADFDQYNAASHMPDSEDNLEALRDALREQAREAENKVQALRTQLAAHQQRRMREAAISKLTPEERAKIVDEEDTDKQDVDDLDAIFDYLLYIGSAPLPNNAADMSSSNFIEAHAELRAKAMQAPDTLKQIEFTHLRFTEANNQLREGPNGNVRHCTLTGTSYDLPFVLSFDVNDTDLTVSDLNFELNIEMHMDIGSILEKVQETSSLLSFFRILTHYSKLDHERKRVFTRLKKTFKKTQVKVEDLAEDRIKFFTNRLDYPELILSWKTTAIDDDRDDLPINICEHILPCIRMEAVLSEQWSSKGNTEVMDNLQDYYQQLLLSKGVFLATKFMVEVILKPNDR